MSRQKSGNILLLPRCVLAVETRLQSSTNLNFVHFPLVFLLQVRQEVADDRPPCGSGELVHRFDVSGAVSWS